MSGDQTALALLADEFGSVVAANLNCTAESLAALASDRDLETRQAVAANPNCGAAAVMRLARDSDTSVRSAARHAIVARMTRLASRRDHNSGHGDGRSDKSL